MSKQSKLDDFLPYLMNRVAARMNQNLSEQLAVHGYTFQNWRILAALAAFDRVTLKELTELTVLPQPSVSRNVADLEQMGLLKRNGNRSDLRVTEIALTAPGRQVYEKMRAIALQENTAAMKGISASERNQMRKVLLRMMENRDVVLPRKSRVYPL
jgi:DNA-binding MarR family transcriptional regulator